MASVYEWNKCFSPGGIVQKLIPKPFMVVPGSRYEGCLCEQPPDETSQRPGHDGPAKPLEPFSKVVRAGNQVVEWALGDSVVLVCSGLSEEYELDVSNSVDDESNDK